MWSPTDLLELGRVVLELLEGLLSSWTTPFGAGCVVGVCVVIDIGAPGSWARCAHGLCDGGALGRAMSEPASRFGKEIGWLCTSPRVCLSSWVSCTW